VRIEVASYVLEKPSTDVSSDKLSEYEPRLFSQILGMAKR